MEGRDTPDRLDAVLADAWALLERGAADPRSPLRHPVLATVGLDGLPNARTVLLWGVARAERRLYFGTDLRSPKHAELARVPWALAVFHEPVAQTQLRLRVRVRFRRGDDLTRLAWEQTPPETQRVFATPVPPGHVAPVPIAGPPVAALEEQVGLSEAGYGNFELLESQVLHLDWLHIAARGHRRAAFTWASDDVPQARWLYP